MWSARNLEVVRLNFLLSSRRVTAAAVNVKCCTITAEIFRVLQPGVALAFLVVRRADELRDDAGRLEAAAGTRDEPSPTT